MEDEKFISGYCKQLDCSRMVTVELTDGAVDSIDCCYGSCVYQAGCPMAKEIDKLNS